MALETTAMGETYITNGEGEKFIAATKRNDGTMRKEIKVREGYVPQDEQAAYGKEVKQKSQFPPGYVPDDTPVVPQQKKKEKKKNKENVPEQNGHVQVVEEKKKSEPLPTPAAEPAKRLKNLKKLLTQITELEQKVASKELTPNEDQLEKISRKAQVQLDIKDLELEISGVALPKPQPKSKQAPPPAPMPPAPSKKGASPPAAAAAKEGKTGPAAPPKKEKKEKQQSPPAVEEEKPAPVSVAKSMATESGISQGQDPSKKLKNLKKKLAAIEELETKMKSGYQPTPEQLEKLSKKKEVLDEIKTLG